jgi:hypothetical protein
VNLEIWPYLFYCRTFIAAFVCRYFPTRRPVPSPCENRLETHINVFEAFSAFSFHYGSMCRLRHANFNHRFLQPVQISFFAGASGRGYAKVEKRIGQGLWEHRSFRTGVILFDRHHDIEARVLRAQHKESTDPLVEFKLTVAPQVDLYGRFTGKDAQVQLPIQPNIEWHFTKEGSLVVQVSVSPFTVGGRNPPASFAIGFLWHAVNRISEAMGQSHR